MAFVLGAYQGFAGSLINLMAVSDSGATRGMNHVWKMVIQLMKTAPHALEEYIPPPAKGVASRGAIF